MAKTTDSEFSDTTTAFLGFFGVLFAIGVIAASVIVEGFVLRSLWKWFVVPLGAPAIQITTAIGLSLIIALLTTGPSKKGNSDTWRKVLFGFWFPSWIYLLGFVVHALR